MSLLAAAAVLTAAGYFAHVGSVRKGGDTSSTAAVPQGPGTAPAAALPAPAATGPVADPLLAPPGSVPIEGMSLVEMKDEFAMLMKKRAAVGRRHDESVARINASRNMQTKNAPANSETGVRYREAVLAIERALDAHPSIVALREESAMVVTQKVAVSEQMGEVHKAWREWRVAKQREHGTKADAARAKATDARAQIFKRAGVTGDPRNAQEESKRLTDADVKEFETIALQLKQELAALQEAYDWKKLEVEEKAAHEKDGSAEKLDGLQAQYKALEDRQGAIKSRENELRGSLRRTDSAIAALQQKAMDASSAHLAAVESLPDVVAAREFINGVSARQAAIDRRARVLRQAILAKDPEYKATLDGQAAPAGLALVDERFWRADG